MPAQHSTRPTAQRHRSFPEDQQLFHLVNADDFVRGAFVAKPGAKGAGVAEEVQSNTLRAGARTICCDKPVDQVYAVAITKASVTDVAWCPGAK